MIISQEMLREAVLDFGQRRKKAQTLRRFASKIQMARKRALKRMATTDSIERRARRAAIKIVRKIVAGKLGLNYNELSVSQKMQIDLKVQKKKAIVNKLSARLIPKMKKAEVERLQAMRAVNEEHGAGFEGTIELVNKYVSETPGQDDPFQPGMVLDKEYYFQRYGDLAPAIMSAVVMKTSERARKTDDS